MLAGVTAARAEEAATEIKIDNFAFVPPEVKIKKGTKVVWTNHDDIPHSIVGIGTSLRSKTIDTDQTYAFVFDKAGTVNYICGLHPHMKAKVVVTE